MEIFENLNWLIYGILIGLFVPITLLIGNKQFGISSSLQNICSLILPKSKSVFKSYDFKLNDWKTYFVVGIVMGGFFASNVFTKSSINYLPDDYYTIGGILTLFVGGLLVGFGTRYANGCTSGHSITGLSMLKLSSLIATISFFIGGLFYTFIF
ncbi:MAG: YeeE/YedE family protein [Melioribacteraceae bacterium]|nr:YeeE/YedE family protein [Melioribacteraceae bacterium]